MSIASILKILLIFKTNFFEYIGKTLYFKKEYSLPRDPTFIIVREIFFKKYYNHT